MSIETDKQVGNTILTLVMLILIGIVLFGSSYLFIDSIKHTIKFGIENDKTVFIGYLFGLVPLTAIGIFLKKDSKN